jgi:hypothetical protein
MQRRLSGRGGTADVKSSTSGLDDVGVAVSVAGLGVMLRKVPTMAGGPPPAAAMKPPRSIGNSLSV